MDTYRCELCNLNMRSKEFLVGHLQGKSHHKLAAKLDALNDLAARSVYISGFKSQPSTETVQLALNQFGPVERVIVDRKAGKFAIVEFSNSKPVDLLLHQKSMVIGHDTVQLKKRRVDFDQSNGYNNNDEELISRERLLELLNDCETGNLLRDVQSLISAFRISDVKIEERVEFVSRLSDYVQTFFQTSIKIQIFGSTVTGFGLADADLDLCFSIERSESNGNCGLELLSKTVEDLRHSRISAHDFYSIQRSEQVRLLTRILNEFRKETSTINYLTAVPDARCPVIRFVALEDVHCELSTRNVLGMYKSNFVQKALGNGELAHLLFVIRLWARCFNFFRDPNEPMGHWSSYSISLIFLAFCQKQGLISALKLEDEKKIDSWYVNFYVDQHMSTNFNPHTFLVNFFKFMATVFNQPTVLCLRDGQQYSVEDFKSTDFFQPYASVFKLSLINVQDPIELSHNVTANVTKHYLSLMRSRCMAALCHLRHSSDRAISAIFTTGIARISPTSSVADNVLFTLIEIPSSCSLDKFVEVLENILEEIFLLETEMSAKRARCEDCRTLTYRAACPTWLGRRNLRRALAKSMDTRSAFEIEKEVTNRIVSQFDGTFQALFIQMVVSQENGHMRLEMKKSKLNEANNFFHFISQFLSQNLKLFLDDEEEMDI